MVSRFERHAEDRNARLPAAALCAAVGVLFLALAGGAFAQQPTTKPRALPMQLAGEWKGDFDGMVERRVIRVLVPYSRTLYFNDKKAKATVK